MQEVEPTSSRSVCNELQQQITSVCVTSPRLPSLGSGGTQSALGGSWTPKSPCLAARVSAIKEQGFSEAVAA